MFRDFGGVRNLDELLTLSSFSVKIGSVADEFGVEIKKMLSHIIDNIDNFDKVKHRSMVIQLASEELENLLEEKLPTFRHNNYKANYLPEVDKIYETIVSNKK